MLTFVGMAVDTGDGEDPDMAGAWCVRRAGAAFENTPSAVGAIPSAVGAVGAGRRCDDRRTATPFAEVWYARAMDTALPNDLVVYRSTPEYTEQTVPAGLLRRHATRAGVWARIRVIEGQLRLRLLASAEEQVLTPESPGSVAPEVPHEVAPLGPVRFVVDFLRAP